MTTARDAAPKGAERVHRIRRVTTAVAVAWCVLGLMATDARATAWAIGWDAILRSDDLGESWSAMRRGGRSFGLSFVRPELGWVVAVEDDEPRILRTSDAGETWQDLPLPPLGGNIFAPRDVAFGDALRGVIVGARRRPGSDLHLPTQDSRPALFYTDDGGASWASAVINGTSTGRRTAVELRRVCLLPSGLGLAVGRDAGNTISTLFAVLTTDGGRRWKDITDELSASGVGIGDTIDCGPDGKLRIAGLYGPAVSSDGGRTWQPNMPLP